MKVDVLYLAWNRLVFTRFSFRMLLRNTDWSLVEKLVIHDDGSEDGTYEWLRKQLGRIPVPVELNQEELRSPPAVMNRMVARSNGCEWFAKIDNDIVVPPRWLNDLVGVVERDRGDLHLVGGIKIPRVGIEALGMEAGRMGPPGHNGAEWDGVYGFEPGSHIGGVGLVNARTLRVRPRLAEDRGRFGWTEFQHDYDIVRGWIRPDLLVCSLDQVPFEPWFSLTEEYREREGWQRPWGRYHEFWGRYYWDWWDTKDVERAVKGR